MMIQFTYDKYANAISVILSEAKSSKTMELTNNIIADYDKHGKLINVEILNAEDTNE